MPACSHHCHRFFGLIVSAIALTTLGSAVAVAETATTDRPPNIVLMLSDDLSCMDIGCYGNPDVKTPNIDRLAGQGMRFTNCFTATGMCSPTRQQLYTGLFPVRNGAYPNHSQVKPGTKSMVHYFKALGYRVALSGKFHIGPVASFPFERLGGSPDFKQIEEFIGRDKAQPYCLVVTSHSPHAPWTEGDASAYPPQQLTLPPSLIDTPETREALSKYYAEVTDFDRELGICTELVRAAGDEAKTIFIFTSEQGSNFPFAKWTCYDLGLRTALVVRWPGHIEPGSVSGALVQYVDVLPTLLEAVPDKKIAGLDGRSFLPVLLGRTDQFRRFVYGVHTTRGIINATPEGYPIRSIRSQTYHYIANLNHEATFSNVVTGGRFPFWQSWVRKAQTDPRAAARVKMYQHRPAEEFYDVTSDPFELNNLAGDPKNRERMDAMRQRLDAWMAQQGDHGLATELAYKKKRKQ